MRVITAEMVHAGAEALKGHIAQMGCTCRWDDDGNPPPDCACGQRADRERWALAERVLRAAASTEKRREAAAARPVHPQGKDRP